MAGRAGAPGRRLEAAAAAGAAPSAEQAQLLASLREQGEQVFAKLDQSAPLLAELIAQVEAQRGGARAVAGKPGAAALAHRAAGPAGGRADPPDRSAARRVRRAAAGSFPAGRRARQQAPLVTELVRQIQAQRDELQPLPEGVAALFAKLDQQAPIVLELVRQVEAQRTELSPAMHATLRQLAQLQDETRQAFARMEAQAPAIQANAQQLEALREESRQVFAKLDQTGPLLAELVAQIEAQRGAIDSVTSRWIKSPMVQEMIRLVGQVHEQGQATAARFDAEYARLERLSQEVEGVGDRIEGSPILQAQVQQLAHLREDSQQLAVAPGSAVAATGRSSPGAWMRATTRWRR
jgi:hypothetical protein